MAKPKYALEHLRFAARNRGLTCSDGICTVVKDSVVRKVPALRLEAEVEDEVGEGEIAGFISADDFAMPFGTKSTPDPLI